MRRIIITLAASLGLLQQAAMAAGPIAPAGSPDTDLVTGMDRSAQPGNDFFAYANGAWLAATEIPADRGSYGLFAQLADVTDERVAKLLAGAHTPAQGPDAVAASTYYTTFMDEAKIEARGLAGLKPELERIEALSSKEQLSSYLGSTLRADVDILNSTELHTDHLFGLWVAQDLDDPTHYSPFLLQGGLGMPDRDYYVGDSARMKEMRAHYKDYVAAQLALAGTPATETERQAAAVLALEEQIAKAHESRAESEDVKRGDNHWTRQDFAHQAPGIDWQRYFEAAQLSAPQQEFVVWQPGAVTGISALVASEPLDTWKAYLRFHALDHFASVLPKAFVDQSFAFHGKTLQGTQELRPRWKRAVSATNAAMGDAVGRMYAAAYFPPEAKARIQALVSDLLASFAVRIDGLSWMDPATKREAKAKLAALKVGVGYPDHWRNYRGLKVVAGDALGNAQRAEIFQYHRAIAKLGKPVDRSEWAMLPQQVNAVNLPAMNALNFPAAILQPPFFDASQSTARNYGGIGAVIGHEISHSFDDQGALFDSHGKLRNWWLPADYEHFRAAGTQLARQYDGYHPFPDLAVNGQQTLSENLADLAGLAVAHSAYVKRAGQEAATTDAAGFNGEQQFFISFAQCWRGKLREPALRQQIITDGHAPGMYRASTVRNIDDWYAAFDVKPGEALYLAPDARVRIW